MKYRIKVCKNEDTGETHYWAQHTKWYWLGWKNIYNRGFLDVLIAQQDIECSKRRQITVSYIYEK
ncbi:hypothetical protein VP496E541_P0109 [Vibrio phage 496E54-1]|nr:hypothetical protein VP495E541_P0110 [Vibrio phage 495E54-1]CAH9013616.1 hypothetical protein VP496E541_P0109 [Vibrio phage 496E54-1]